jgi:hypothetical protein
MAIAASDKDIANMKAQLASNGDATIQAALPIEITHGASVRSTPNRLHFINNLHRPNFRRTAHRSGWKTPLNPSGH